MKFRAQRAQIALLLTPGLSFVMALTLGLLAIVQFRAMKSRDE